jgi:uncharacterized protein (DUF608 family)
MGRQSRRKFIKQCAHGVSAISVAGLIFPDGSGSFLESAGQLFDLKVSERRWMEFLAKDYSRPVSGVKFLGSNPPCCGVPIGGLSTGCLDIDARGVYGFSSIFNSWSKCPAVKNWRMPRKPQWMSPILGLAVGDQVWVMATNEIVGGGSVPVCQDPFFGKPAEPADHRELSRLKGVQPATEIHYWGHYPAVDMEFVNNSPVEVALRAWSPFVPGDAVASNTPAAVFEVHLRNAGAKSQSGTLAFNFPGPDHDEALGSAFGRHDVSESFSGRYVVFDAGLGYVAAVIGREPVRAGGALDEDSWKDIHHSLPAEGKGPSACGGTSLAVDFELGGGESRTIRFLLAWYAPVSKGAERERLAVLQANYAGNAKTEWKASEWSNENYYTLKYAERYRNALEVARDTAQNHVTLLQRVRNWQEAVYMDASLPVWLRDSLINNLCLLAEDAFWVLPQPPLDAWAIPDGAFGLIESPRGDPDLACIPCDWYGNLPVVYFYPQLALSNIRSYKNYQRDDGVVPFWLGVLGELPDFATPSYEWQISLNGTCYIDMVDRVWQRTGNDAILNEFYDSVKRCNTSVMNLRPGPGGPISMPTGNKGMEWFEHGEWAGMCAHLGGLHLAQLRIMHRMAVRMGDRAYAEQCAAWLTDGSRAMEQELWNGSYYLNFFEKESGKRSDDVMAYQLDGEWASRFHGLGGVFEGNRVDKTLSTIRRINIALTPQVGAANFARPNGQALEAKSKIAAYGALAMFPAEVLILAMTYIYSGQRDFGIDLARRHWEAIVCQHGHGWDMPNLVRGDTGERIYGTDYYQSMMLWALPAALAGHDVAACSSGTSLVSRVIAAGRNPNSITST